jgi:hypothetical protein
MVVRDFKRLEIKKPSHVLPWVDEVYDLLARSHEEISR